MASPAVFGDIGLFALSCLYRCGLSGRGVSPGMRKPDTLRGKRAG